jgi:hypothetical protein
MMLLCSYCPAPLPSSMCTTVPFSTQGLTTTMGTRTPARSNANGSSVALRPSGLGAAGGGTWSQKPPCSSYVMKSAVFSHRGDARRVS